MVKYDLAKEFKKVKVAKPHPDGFIGALKEELAKIRRTNAGCR